MGLDAIVYCDCFETGRLKELPPYPDSIFVGLDGSLNCKCEDLQALMEFDQWLLYRACEHEDGILLHHYIGNIALVSLLRTELSLEAEKFPIMLQKVIYNGVHAGDYLSLAEIENLKGELAQLKEFVCSSQINKDFVDYFYQQLSELVESALQVSKPISF